LKSTRKNRFKNENTVRRARLRGWVVCLAKVVGISLALVTVSAGFILVHDFFMQSSQFFAQDIGVSGNRRLSQKQVMDIAGIDLQTNILSLNLMTTRKRLLADPWIADATVSRKIPSEITISIHEEQALALLEMEDGQEFLINIDGRVFKRADETDGGKLPRVQGLSFGDLPVPGKPDTEPFRSVMSLLRLTREKDSVLVHAGLHWIHMDREIGATVYTDRDHRTIKFGFGHYREKCSALRYLMAQVKSDSRLARSQVIDLYDVNRIVITLAPAGASGSDQEEV
jgi:cell division protein FtsQ